MFLFQLSLNGDNPSERSLVIFSGQLEGGDFDYGSRLEIELARYPVAPDNILFIFPEHIEGDLNSLLLPGTRFIRNVTRYGDKTNIYFFKFGDYSDLSQLSFEGFEEGFSVDLEDLKQAIVSDGVFLLAESRRDQVVQKSPSGTVFVKPSSEEFEEFIKASELAVGYSENQFLAFCLLSKKPRSVPVKHIWIDTSGISSFIEALIYYIYKFSDSSCKTVTYSSYKSYSNLNECKPDYVGNVWMIISASTSNNLGQRAANEWGMNDDQVITLLSYRDGEPDNVGDKVVANIGRLSSANEHLRKVGAAIGVAIQGENFTAQVKEPNKVLIKSKHKPSEIETSIFPFHYMDSLACNKLGRDLFVDVEMVIKEDPGKALRSWIEKIVGWYAPSNLEWITFQAECSASALLADIVLEKLSEFNLSKSIKKIDLKDAETMVSGDGSVLILSPVVTKGSSLLKVNRNLRLSKHNGNRVFLCPFVTPPSRSDFVSLYNTLTYGPGGLKYQFFYFHKIHAGSNEAENAWKDELDLIENFSDEFWVFRARALSRQSQGLTLDVGTPAAPSRAPLDFTQDFAFWSKKYDPKKVRSSSVYASISSILQSLRDKPYSELDRDFLTASAYQHSVIDPENFLRFDDPLLHTCLWRSAIGSELDYSSSPAMSSVFSEFLCRLLSGYSEGRENAALDLLVGLAVKRIRLSKKCFCEIMDKVKELFPSNTAVMELVTYIDEFLLLRKVGPNSRAEQAI